MPTSLTLLGDHPRVCGEHQRPRGVAHPACVFGDFRDHPRLCGEHRGLVPQAKPADGSSPHSRGTRIRNSKLDCT